MSLIATKKSRPKSLERLLAFLPLNRLCLLYHFYIHK